MGIDMDAWILIAGYVSGWLLGIACCLWFDHWIHCRYRRQRRSSPAPSVPAPPAPGGVVFVVHPGQRELALGLATGDDAGIKSAPESP